MNNNCGYKAYYYQNSHTGRALVLEYIDKLPIKDKGKVAAYIALLSNCNGRLDEPYSRYIRSGIRELRIEITHNRHRIFYITVTEKRIILLHAFLKKTPKTPEQEIVRALNNFEDYKINKKLIEYEKES
ncbi:MAG: type II toxin-antitoxin system RelE/ParE family toxin [Candidatus Wildermuthbacteria bacterium]|nr:type II toxin-antitoxin system RelE/ParE family toxin [Candidatus Wildermuthbacteria bacterium]